MIILAGIILGQAVLYGPSLAGWKLLLPLDILTGPNVYLPQAPGTAAIRPHDDQLSDLVYLGEPARRFAAREVHAGRLPIWTPYYFAGTPFNWPILSPFHALQCSTESPVIVAWTQLLAAIVAGLGAGAFCRRALGVGFWPAAIAAWCYPLTGFFVLWQGFGPSLPVCWLPWLLLAVDRTVRGGSRWAPMGLAVTTCFVLNGQLDVAGQVLLVSGLYAVWCCWDAYGRQWFARGARRALLALAAGWTIGFLLAAPYLLPVVDYAGTGGRMRQRAGGTEERPPVGLSALPRVVLPEMYGATVGNSLPVIQAIAPESTAAAYTGVIAALVFGPLAWCSRKHRSRNLFWAFLGLFGLSWCLNVPGFVQALRLPGLNMMSHNRLVFATAFALLALFATGLEVCLTMPPRRRWWYWVSAVVLAGLCCWCIRGAGQFPEGVGRELERQLSSGQQLSWVHDVEGVRLVEAWLVEHYIVMAVWCGIGVLAWVILWFRPVWQSRLVLVGTAVLLSELLWVAHERFVQSDPALYYPKIPVLEQVAKAGSGRVIGAVCLPANLAGVCGLRDVRGYDAVDPASFIDLLKIGGDPKQAPTYVYAVTQWLAPRAGLTPEGILRFSPILDMLAVSYVITRTPPPPKMPPVFQGPGYWVLTNATALPRTYIPRQVEVVPDSSARLEKLASAAFDPRKVAYVEAPVEVPAECRGHSEIVEETPTRIRVAVRMETPGLLVLADQWTKGWRAYLGGKEVPVLRVNHALRGVVLPAGEGKLEFRYQPASLAWGLRLAGLGALLLLGWAGIGWWNVRRGGSVTAGTRISPDAG